MRQPASRPGLGFGLMLMAEAADGFVIGNRGGGGTEVELRFRIGSPARA
jgi:hypothetical protein